MLGGIVTHRSPVTLRDVDADRAADRRVRGASPCPRRRRSARCSDLRRARSRRGPESISWGGGSAGGSDQILAGLVADAVGVDAAARQLHRVLRRRRVAVGDPRRPGVGRHQRPRRVRAADRGRHGARAGDLERRAAARRSTCRRCASRASTSSSRTGARWSRRPGLSRAERQRLEAVVGAMVHSPTWREALDALPLARSLSRRRRVRALRRRRGSARARHPARSSARATRRRRVADVRVSAVVLIGLARARVVAARPCATWRRQRGGRGHDADAPAWRPLALRGGRRRRCTCCWPSARDSCIAAAVLFWLHRARLRPAPPAARRLAFALACRSASLSCCSPACCSCRCRPASARRRWL